LALGVLAAVGCQDLTVPNLNNPDRERALNNPGDVQTLIASSWESYFWRNHVQGWPYFAATTIGGTHITSVANNGAVTMSEFPRPQYDNNPTSEVDGIARFPWYGYYSDLDSSNEGLRAILDGGLEIGEDGRDTHRAITFGKFTQGLNLGYIGMMFDQGFIAKEDSDLEDPATLELHPYRDVLAAAIESMEEAIELAQQGSFVIPESWMQARLTNEEVARLAHSFIARFHVYGARTPEERAQVDWAAVIHHTENGIVDDFVINHDISVMSASNWRSRLQRNTWGGFRASGWFLGWADTSGNFQEWISAPVEDRRRFEIETPDRRITGETADSDGTYFIYRPDAVALPERGLWRQSYYQFQRWGGPQADRNVPMILMSVDEMNLLRAEAFARTGRDQDAADLVNITRVGHGELPPVTAAGVPQTADCVPRDRQGQCMDLLGAIMWERKVEGTGLEATRDWLDNRGWGTLITGTIVHLPVPGRELEVLNLPIYTFGGGGEGSAAGMPIE
jgi:hypothetical protein